VLETTQWPASRNKANARRPAVTGRFLGAALAMVTALVTAVALTLTGVQPAIPGIGLVAPVAAAGPEVTITDGAYKPASLTITQGDVVTWTNAGTNQHTVTANGDSFDSGPLDAGSAFGNLFDTPGTFPYHDTLNPTMKGTVIVKAAKPTPTPNGTPAPSRPPGTLPPNFVPATPSPPPTPVASASQPATTPPSGDAGGPGSSPALLVAVAIVVIAAVIVAGLALRKRRGTDRS
jgi:plastocyanin